MSNRNRRLCSLLLCAALLLLMPSAALTADAGVTASVTIGTGLAAKPAAEVEARWDSGWFMEKASVYRRELALTAMALSGAAYVRDAEQVPCVQTALEAFGFTRVQSYNAHIPIIASDKVAYTFAEQTLRSREGKPLRLAAVVIRGTGEYTEWASNLNVGTGSCHTGFSRAADELLGSLAAYLAQSGPAKAGETVKFFITGHSRGGAAANLLAARLADSGLVKKEDVFCYTFAAPAVSVEAAEEGYENIFNIVNETDLVTQVPLSAWGYRRYGVDKPLPTGDAALFDGMNRQYKALSGQEYAAYRDPETVERITAAVRRLAPSTSSANMELIAAILNGDLEELSRRMKQGGALAMGRTALRLSAELAPLLGQEQEALRSAHCMAGYYSWLSASPS